MMNEIEQALLLAIKKQTDTPIIIAFSGGVDSQVLLHALASLKRQSLLLNPISVCHVNHGLSTNAKQWQEFAKQQCQLYSLPLTICKVNIKPQAQQSLEALARDARYQALTTISSTPSLIITGHHSDDQAETFLLALKRGSGIKGLSAMASEVKHGNNLIVRPLLNISRQQIVDYAKKHRLTWVEDESNSDNRFDRNFIRNDIMPLLTKRWPSIANTMNRSSEHCQEGQLLLDELAMQDLSLCQHDKDGLCVVALSQLSMARFKNLIRYYLSIRHCLMPSTEQLTQLHQQLGAEKDKNPSVKVGECYFRRYKSVIYLTEELSDISHWQTDIDLSVNNQIINLPDNLENISIIKKQAGCSEQENNAELNVCVVEAPTKDCKVSIKFSHNNPTCQPDYRNHSRSLKKVLQELNIPPWQRKRVPFLYYDDVLVAALGYFVCQPYLPKVGEEVIEIIN